MLYEYHEHEWRQCSFLPKCPIVQLYVAGLLSEHAMTTGLSEHPTVMEVHSNLLHLTLNREV